MSVTILRPNTTNSSTGFDPAGNDLALAIGDNNNSTNTTQTSNVANFSVGFSNFPESHNANIVSITPSLTGQLTAKTLLEITTLIKLSNGDLLSESILNWDSLLAQTMDGTTVLNTVDKPLTPVILNEIYMVVTPNTGGIRVDELFLTVVYYESTRLEINNGRVQINNGKITM